MRLMSENTYAMLISLPKHNTAAGTLKSAQWRSGAEGLWQDPPPNFLQTWESEAKACAQSSKLYRKQPSEAASGFL